MWRKTDVGFSSKMSGEGYTILHEDCELVGRLGAIEPWF